MSREYTKWTPEEQVTINYIIDGQKKRGEKINWKYIAEQMGTKTARECYDYHLVHKDNVSERRHVWTKAEEDLLSASAEETNRCWSEVQRLHFPLFSVSQLRNKYNHMIANKVESSFSSVSSSIMSDMSEIPTCITSEIGEPKDNFAQVEQEMPQQEMPFPSYPPPRIVPLADTELQIGKFTIFDGEKNDEDISFGYPFGEV